MCKVHIENIKCNVKGCKERHPKVYKWFQREAGCRRVNCDCLHANLAQNVTKKLNIFHSLY